MWEDVMEQVAGAIIAKQEQWVVDVLIKHCGAKDKEEIIRNFQHLYDYGVDFVKRENRIEAVKDDVVIGYWDENLQTRYEDGKAVLHVDCQVF